MCPFSKEKRRKKLNYGLEKHEAFHIAYIIWTDGSISSIVTCGSPKHDVWNVVLCHQPKYSLLLFHYTPPYGPFVTRWACLSAWQLESMATNIYIYIIPYTQTASQAVPLCEHLYDRKCPDNGPIISPPSPPLSCCSGFFLASFLKSTR